MSKKDFSSLQEHNIASYLGWSVVSGSGSRACIPGDIYSEDWLGECKTHTTVVSSIHFDLAVWKKITDEAVFRHKYPVLFVDDGSQDVYNTWCMFRLSSISSEDIAINYTYMQSHVTKHINFKPEEAFRDLNHTKYLHPKNYPAVFRLELNKEVIGITSLVNFREIFGD